jgi:K+-transporting ATPase ATPase C chain
MIVFGVAYPLLITGIAVLLAPNSGAGTTIHVNGKVVGFEVIGQLFDSDKYFNGRPSAVGYNAASTGGSNKGPTNPDYLAQVDDRISVFLSKNPGVDKKDIPVDLVTASGGGLDPHISPASALVQVGRIAKARGIKEELLRRLIQQNTKEPLLGLFGTPTVHVLRLNLALDNLK